MTDYARDVVENANDHVNTVGYDSSRDAVALKQAFFAGTDVSGYAPDIKLVDAFIAGMVYRAKVNAEALAGAQGKEAEATDELGSVVALRRRASSQLGRSIPDHPNHP